MGLLVKDVLSYMKPVIDHASDAYKVCVDLEGGQVGKGINHY